MISIHISENKAKIKHTPSTYRSSVLSQGPGRPRSGLARDRFAPAAIFLPTSAGATVISCSLRILPLRRRRRQNSGSGLLDELVLRLHLGATVVSAIVAAMLCLCGLHIGAVRPLIFLLALVYHYLPQFRLSLGKLHRPGIFMRKSRVNVAVDICLYLFLYLFLSIHVIYVLLLQVILGFLQILKPFSVLRQCSYLLRSFYALKKRGIEITSNK
jgi:hypothetical protein